MIHAKRLIILLSVGLLGLTAFGCTDDPAQGTSKENNRPVDPVDAPDNGQLMHVDPCTPGQSNCVVELTTLNERVVEVLLVDDEGAPVSDALINFEGTYTGTEITHSPANSYTDEDGIAKTTLSAGNLVGAGELVASTNTESIEPVKWVVGVSSKDQASYRVHFDHNGSAEMKMINVTLYENDQVSCADLAAGPHQAYIGKTGQTDGAGNLPTVVFPDEPNGAKYTVEAKAMSLVNNEVEVAYGCEDDTDAISDGQPVDVTVQLIDHIPTVVGEYDVIHQFDLTDALPENIRTVVDLIGRLATDPGSFVVGCPSDSSDADCPSDSPSLVGLLKDFLPDGGLKDAIEGFLDSSLGNSLAREAINAIADDWIQNSAPDWVRNSVNISADILQSVREFRVRGTMRITEPPVIDIDQNTGEVVGILPEDAGEQSWNDFIFFWRRGCENATDPDACAEREFGAQQLGISAATGEFTGTVFGSNELAINQHSLSLNYGALMVALVEKVVLPEVFGSECGQSNNLPCDTLELALQELLSCEDVANYARDAAPGDSETIYDVAYDLCDEMIHQAGDQLRDYASEELVADGEEVFLIATPADAHCTIHQPEVYQGDWVDKPYPYVQFLGKEEEDMRCEWDVQIVFSDSYTAEVGGTFYGQRTGDIE
jgi:hypothetical protein